jgi:hypothetical protein
MEILESTTQLQNQNYADGSDQWLDAMLVCIKTQEIPSVKMVLSILSSWINMKENPEVEKIQQNIPVIRDLQFDKQKFVEMILKGILSDKKLYPKWYEAISYLMIVYTERKDLQAAFPNVSQRCDLSDLFRWAKDYGVNDDNRLKPYFQFYQKYFEQTKD